MDSSNTKTSSGPLVVRTRNSTYRLGPENDSGERTISRDNTQLSFTRCKIISLKAGLSMILTILDGPDKHLELHSSNVRSIKKS